MKMKKIKDGSLYGNKQGGTQMRFGVIGIGSIGWTNVPALMSFPEVEIVAVANRTEAKARQFCEKLGLTCPVYGDWREMIIAQKPDAVLIQLYNDLHFECFLECARHGIHILVENDGVKLDIQ